MGLLSRLIALVGGADETKAVDFSPEFMAAVNGVWGVPSNSGESVSIATAMRVTPFYRGMVAIAEGVAQLPIEIYKRRPNGKGAEPALDHPLYDTLRYRPNLLQDSFQFWRTTLMHAVGSGDGVSYKNVVNGQVRELIPIRPELLSINVNNQFMVREYQLGFENGSTAVVGQREVFHIAGPSWSVEHGVDPTSIGREALGLAQATERTHAALHKNGVRAGGTLETDLKLDKAQLDLLRAEWQRAYAGASNTGQTPVLQGGLKFKPLTQTGVDSEHLNTRKHQIEEIARLLGIFPIMLGHAGDQSPTFASADAFLEAHVRFTLQPWFKALTMAVETQLLTPDERKEGYFCRIDSSELLRGSLKDRTDYYKAGLGTNSSPGWLTPNEVREDDGWNPDEEPDMDKVWQPATMSPAGTPAADPAPPAQPGDQGVKSSAPRTLYVSRKLKNGEEVLRWARSQGFQSLMPAQSLHVTIAYSKTKIDWMLVGEGWPFDDAEMTVGAGGPRVVEAMSDKGPIALLFASSKLSHRHHEIVEAGASWDHPDYQPHITLSYGDAGLDLTKIEPYRGELVFGPEIFSEIDLSSSNRKV